MASEGDPPVEHSHSSKGEISASFLRAARGGNLDKVLELLRGGTDINTSNANGLNALHLASKEGHSDVVRELLKRKANVDAATRKGNTALHIASLAGQSLIVTILVENGANVNVQSLNGFTPLYMAAQENHEDVVRFLLTHGANQALSTEDGFTPLAVALQQGHDRVVALLLENDTKGKVRLPALHIAAKKDDTKAATLLLQNDHNADVTSKSGFTPLHIAAHYGNENVAQLLIEKGANVNYTARHNISPLHVATKWGRANMVQLLLQHGAVIDSRTRDLLTPLHCAARSGHDQVVDMLLEKGAPISAKTKNGLAPLHMAAQGDHVDSARILLYHRAPVDDVTVDYLTPLHVAAHCGHVRVAKLLLDRNADPNARALNGFTPLHIACKKNRIKVVELLLKYHASIEATTESGLSPLHVASFMGAINIVIYLLQQGANPDVATVRGETPLHLAARANQTDVVRVLIRNGAKVDAQARELQTPLHIASRLGNTDIVVLLLQAGANANSATRDQYTPLHIAAKEGQEEVAAILLDHGADKTLLTKKGFTPLHLASKYGNVEVVKLLLEKGCTVDIEGKNQVTPLHVAAHYNNDKVAMLLLEHGASAKAAAKNGYTPLHIAAKKNQMDIAGTLLQYHGDPNAKSRAGFTPLHLASQEGHKDMAALLIENGSDVGAKANNGLTSMHLCAQEDHVPVAEELYRHHAEINPQTNAGYTPLHVACHFGQINMVRFLVEHGANVSEKTRANFTPLHQAAQQGHNNVVRYLLDHGASPNEKNSQGQTPLAIAQRLGYVSVVETLKTVTETTVITETTTVHEDKYKPQNPEAMNETMFSESEDEGAAAEHETAAAHVKDFSDNLTQGLVDEQAVHHISFSEHQLLNKSSELENSKFAPEAYHDNLDEVIRRAQAQPLHTAPIMNDSLMDKSIQNDNIPIGHNVAQPSKLLHKTFLISFLVDARGGAMRGCRHSGVRIIVPPRKASQPIRVTCRYLRKDKLAHPPPLSEGEELASRILEMAPAGAKFLGPVILEVPHFASLRDREREIVILRSDDGQHWKEHQLEATEDAVQEVLNESFDAEELAALDDLQTPRITRILTNDFPMYFAVVTRVRQEVHCVGPEGGVIVSSVVPRVQAIFPDGSLTKTIKVSVQAQPVPQEMVTRLHGNRVAVSPIVTVEPRRRKFHKPITLCIPLPQSGNKAMLTQYSGQPGQEPPTLRLLCSITGGSAPAQWEDITGTTQLTFTGEEVSFTTTVSARFWLMDCQTPRDAARMAQEVYNEAISIPYMAKFAVFARRTFPVEGQLRVFCMTDDKEDKTLEKQEHFKLIAKSRDVEVLKGKHQFLEFAGNLVPVTKSGDQLSLFFQPFQENRLAFMVKTRNKDDSEAETEGRIAFMREPKNRSEALPPQAPICTLAITLPEYTGELPTPVVVKRDTTPFDQKYRGVLDKDLPDFIHQNVLKGVGPDWQRLARALEVPHRDIQQVRQKYPGKELPHILKIWIHLKGKEEATPENLDNALKRIGRDDIVRSILHGEPETLSYGSESPSSKRFEKYESAPLEPSKKYVDLPPVSGVSEPIVVTRHVVHHEESHTEEPHQTSSVAYKEADALPVAQRATPLRSEEAEPVTQTIPEEEEEEAPVSEVRTVVRTERHVHDTDEGPVVEERTITTTYEDDVAVNEHVVDRTVPLTEEEQEKWDSLHKEAEASLGGKLESSHTLPEGVEQEVETEQHVEDDGTIVTTTTMTSHYTETRSESPMEKIYEEDALQGCSQQLLAGHCACAMSAIPVVFGFTSTGDLLIQGVVEYSEGTSAHEVHHVESKNHFEVESWSGEHEEHHEHHHVEERRDSLLQEQHDHTHDEDTPIASSEHFERKRTASLAAALLEIDPQGAPLIHFFHPTADSTPLLEAEEDAAAEIEDAGESEKIISSLLFLLREMKTTSPDKYASAVERLRDLEAELRAAGAVTPADPAVSDAVARALAAAGPGRDVQIRVNQSRHTTTTKTVYETETPGMAGLDPEKIRELHQQMLASLTSGHTDSSADSGTTQKKETAEEGFTNEDGSVVVSKKMTRVVTTTKTTLPGEGEAAPESPTESLGSVKDRIAKFEQLKEGDRTSVTSLASSTSGERVERSSLDRIPVDIVVTPVSPVPPQEDEEDEIAEAQEPLSPSVEEISQAEVKSLDSYGDEKDISPPMTDRSQEIILERTEEEQEPLSPDTDRSSSAELLANEPESARKHKKREILEQSTTTTYDFSTSKEDRRYLQRGDEGEHPEEHLGEHDKEYTHEKALESPEKETSFHRAETTFAYQHETSPREDENPSAFDKLKGFGKVAAGVVAAPVALASVGAAAIYDKLRGDDELHDDHPEIEPAPAISELIRQAEEPVTPLQKEHPVEEEEKEPHTRKEIFEQSTTTTYDFTTSKEDRRQLEHEEEGEQPEEGFEERPHHMTETVITESYYEEPSPRDKGSVHEEGHEPQHVIETTKIVREISYEEPKEGEKFHEESIHEPHHIVETTTTTREYDEPASPSASEKDASTRSLKDWSPEKEEHHSETHHIVETTTTVREIFYEKPESPAEEREPLEEVSALTEKELEEPEEEKPHHVIETTTTRREYGELEEKYSPKEEGSVSTDYIEEKIEEQPHHVIETTTITREIFYDESESPTKVEEHPKSLVSPDESKVEAEVQPSPLHEEVVHDRVPEHYEVEEQHKPHHFIETTTIRREYYEPEEEYSPKEEEPATHLEEKLASPSQEEPQNEENDEESTKDKLLGLAKGVGKVIAAPVALAAVGAAAAYEKLRGESDEEENLPELQQFEQHKEAGHDESKTPSPTIEERPYHVIETTTIRSEYDEPEERYSPEEKGPVSTAHVEEEVEERPHHVIETTAITKEYYEEPEETSSSPAGNEKESIHSIKEQKTQEDLSSGIIESEPYEEEPHPHIIETTKIVKETFYDEPEAVQEKVPEEEEKLHHIVETTTITREFYEPEERAVSPGEEPVEETDAPHHVVETITTIKEIVYDEPEAEFPVKSEKESLHEEPITPVEQEHHIIETTTTTREYYEEPEQISAEEPTAEHHEPHHIVKTITTEKHYFEEPEDEEKPHHTVETITVTREIVSEPTTPEEQEPVEEHTVIEEPHHIIDTTTTTREYDEESEDKDHPEEHRHVIETTTVTREAYYDEPEAFESPVVSERKSEHVSEILSPAPSPVEQPDTHFETEEGEEYSLLKRTSLPKQEQFAEPPPPYKERESPAGHEEEEEGESTKDKILGFAKGAGKVAAGIIAAPVALAAVGAAAAYDKLKGEGEEPSPVHEEHRFEEHFEKEEPHPAHEEHLFEPSPVRESTHEEKASKPVTPSEEEHHEIHRVVETITTRRETFGDEEQHIVETTTTSHEYYEPESPMKESEHYEEQPSPAKGSIHEEKVSPIVEHTEPLMSEKEPFHKEEKPTIHDEKVSEPASPVKEHFEESAHYEDQPLKSSSRESIHEEKVSEPTSLAESPIVREKEPTHEEHEQAHRPHHIETTVVTKETFYDETGSPTVSEKEIPSEVASTHSSHHDNARDVQITTKTREYFDEPIEGHEKAISPGEEHRRVIETTTTVKETFYDEGSNRASPASSEKEPEEENEEEEEHREPYHVVETTTTVKEYYDEPSEGQKEILEERSFEERSIPEEPEEPLRLVDTTTTKREYFEEEPETGHAHEIHRVVETTTVTRETFYDETPESERPVVESASPIEEHKEMEPPVGQQSIEEYHEPKPHQDERHFEPPPPYTEKESPITEHQEVEEDEESTKDKIFGFAKGAGKIAAGIIAAPVALAAVGAAAAYEKLKGDSDEEDNFLEEHKDYPAHEELLLEEMSPATHEAHTEEQQPLATPAQEKPYIIESSSPTKEFHEEPSSPGLAKREADFDESEIEEHKIHHIVETTTVTREYDEAEEKEEEPHHVVETTVTTREAYFDEPSTPEEQKVFEEEKPEDLHKVVVSTTETKDYFEEPHDEEKKEDEEDLHESRHVIETTTVTKETFYDENEPADENEFPHHIVETTTTTKEYFDEPSTPETKEEEQEIERPHHVETTTTTKEYFYDEPAEESVHEQENIQETYPDKITETTTTVRDYFEEPAEEEEEKPHHVVETTTTVKETFFDEPTQAEEHPEEPHVLETTVTAKYTDEPSEKEEEPQVEIVSREEQPHVIESTSYETEAQYDEPSSPVVKEKHFEEAEDYQQGLESPAESEEEEGASSTKKKSLGSKIFGFAKKAGVAVVAPVALAAHALSSKDQKDIQGKEVMHEGEERVYTFQGQETESDESAQASPEVLRKAESPREEEHVIPSDEYEAPTTTALPLDQESLVSSEGYIIESQTYEDLSQTPATSIKVDTVADEEEEEDRLPEEETHVIPSTDYHPSHHEEQIHIDSRTEWPIAEEEEETHVIPSEDYHPSHHEEQIHIDSRTEWPIAEEEYIIESTPYEDYGTIEAVHEPEEEILERRQSIVKRELSDEEDDKSITTTTTGTTIIEQPIHFEEEIHEPEFEVGEKPGTPTSTDSRIIHDVPEETSPSQKSTEEEYREQVIPTITKDIYHFEEEELEDHFEEKQQESPKEGTAPVVSGVTAEGEPIISGHVSSPPSPVRHIPGTVIYHEEELQREPATQEEQFYTEESRFEPPPAYTEKESPEHHEVQQPEEEEESTSDKLFGFAKGVGKVAAGIIAAPVALAAVGAVAAYDKLKGGEEEEDEESFLDKPIPTQVQKTPATPVKDEQAPSSPTPSLEEPIHHEIETISARTTEEATIFEKPAVSEKEFVPEEASPAESEKQFIEEEHERAHHVIETTTITREYYDEPEEKRTPEEEHHDEEHHHRHVVETTTTVKEIVFDEPESPTKEEEEKLISPVESETHLETETERPGHLLETTTFTREYDEPSNLASPSESEKDFLKPQAEPYAGTTEPSRTESPVQEEEKDEVVPDQPTDIHREFLEEHDPHHIVETTTITREYYEDPTEEDLSSPTQERPVEDVLETHHEPHHVVETTTITTEKFYHEEPEEGREEEIYTMKRPSVTEITTITVDKHYLPESEEIQTERTSLSETPVESEFPPTEQGEDHMESSEIHDHPINDEHIREELEPHHHVIETTTIVTESRYVDEHHEETTPVVAGITAEGEPIISGHVSSPPSPGRHVTEEFHHEELQREQHPDQFYTEEESHFEPPPSISEKESPVTEHEGYQPEEEDEESTKDKILGFAKGAGKIAAGIIAAPVALAAVGAAAAYEKLKGESDEEEDNFLDKPVPRRTSALEEDVVAPKESPVEQVKRSFEEEEHHIPQDLEHTTTLTSTTQQYTPEKEELSSPEEGHKYEKFSPEDYERPVVESADEEDHQMETRFDESPKDEKASIQDEYEIVEEQLSPESKLEISDFVTDVVEEATAGAVIEATEELTPRSQKEDHLQSLEELALENVNRMRIEQEDETGDHLHSLEKQSEESPSSDQDESRLIAGDDEWKVYDSTGQVVEEFSAQLTDKAIEEAGSDVTQAFSSVTPGKSRSLVTQESINDVSMEPEVDYHSDLQEKLDILAGQKSESLPMVREEELDVIRESDGESEEHDPIAETASRLVDEVIETVLEEQEGPRTTSDLFYSATEKSTKDDQYDTCVTSQEDTYDTAQGWTSQDSEYTTATSEAPSRLSEMDDRTEGTTTPQAAISPVDSDRQFVVDLDNEGRPRPMRSFTLDDETARSTPDVALQITIEEEEEGDETLATSPSGVLLGPNMDPGRPISPVPPRKQAADDEEEGMFVFVAKETPKDLESVDSVDIPEPITTREVSEYTRHSSDVSSESRADTVIHKEHEKDDQTSLDEPLTSTRQSEGSSDSLDKASIKSTGRLSSGSSIKAAEEPLEPVEKDSPRSQDLSPEQPKSSIGSADLSPRQESPQMEHQVLETEEGFVIYHQGEEGGELETVEEEPEDSDSLNGGSGNSSVGAPVNLGKYKHVSSDNVSLTSLQEFERLEQLVASRGDNSLTASEIELYASGRPRSMEGSLSSLAEFEKLEQEAAHQANLSPHDEMMLSVVKEESEAEDMSIRDDDEEEVFSETELKTRPVNEEENRASTPQALSPTDSLERDLISNMAMMETSADSLEPSFQSKPTDIMADSLTEYEVVPRMDSTRDSLENIPQDKDSLLEGASQDLASQETHGLLSGDTVGTYQEHDDDDKDSLGGEMESMLRSYPTTLTTFETTTVAPDGSIQTISRRVETRVVDPVMSHVTFTGTESQERLNQLPLEQPIETVDAQGNVTRTLFKKQPPHSE